MIFGDPGKFAIQTDYVQDWNRTRPKLGLFQVFLNWHRMDSATVSSEDPWFQTNQLDGCLKSVLQPIALTENLQKKEPLTLLSLLIDITFPKDADVPESQNCWDYVISPDGLHDKKFFLFRYAENGQETILGGSTKLGFAIHTTNPIGYINEVVSDALRFCINETKDSTSAGFLKPK